MGLADFRQRPIDLPKRLAPLAGDPVKLDLQLSALFFTPCDLASSLGDGRKQGLEFRLDLLLLTIVGGLCQALLRRVGLTLRLPQRSPSGSEIWS